MKRTVFLSAAAMVLGLASLAYARGFGGAPPGGSHGSEAARAAEASRVAPPASQQASNPVRPLPPPIMVSTPPAEQTGTVSPGQAYPNAARNDDPNRPTPPADIPGARPLELQAGVAPADSQPPRDREHKNVAEDVLTGVKSMFHAVLPQ